MQLHAKGVTLGFSNFTKALALSKGSNNTRRKAAFMAAIVQVRDIGQGDASMTAYNNFEVMEGVKE
jgi:hypothetical protein